MNKNFHISIAPMMDWTDRHCRYFHRLLSPHALLYTEMVTTGALIHGDRDRFLRYNDQEHPLALQLGGCDAADLATCAKMGEDAGYDEINLNCGCPSDRVQKGKIGAILMAEPETVADGVAAMRDAVDIPVTVKCRIAIDDAEEEPFLDRFIKVVSAAGCKTFIIHARKAWLKGLSPKENRDVPPLNYDLVKQMKARYPHLTIIINGGIGSIEDIHALEDSVDGAMIGRSAYQTPYFLTGIEKDIFGNAHIISRETAALEMIPYIEQQEKDFGTPVKSITRHMMGLFAGQPGAKRWKQTLSNAHKDGTTVKIIHEALNAMQSARLSGEALTKTNQYEAAE